MSHRKVNADFNMNKNNFAPKVGLFKKLLLERIL
ncbi:unnamed protein product, partial [marine sediment metagenome]